MNPWKKERFLLQKPSFSVTSIVRLFLVISNFVDPYFGESPSWLVGNGALPTNGHSHQVQKMVSHLSAAASDLVAQELRHFAVRAAKNRQACRILCRLMVRDPGFFGGESLGESLGKMVIFPFFGGIFFGWFVVGWFSPPKAKQWEKGFFGGPGPHFCASLFAQKKWQEFRGAGGPTWYLIEELLGEVGALCFHSYAHHVIQSVLEHGEAGWWVHIPNVQILGRDQESKNVPSIKTGGPILNLSWSYIPRLSVQRMANIYIYTYIYIYT